MRLMLHTLAKDVRRLWPAAVITWVMLAVLANADRWRADSIPSPMEGWMNLVLSMAWACLAALAVLEEPLVGDRNFWTTRPHRWTSLLAAKLAFVVLAIHLPSFVADACILAARGFSPLPYTGDLLWKQALFFGALTLPALALATLVRNFAHFVIVVFTIAAGLAVLNGGLSSFPAYRGMSGEVRHALVRLVLAAAAAAVIAIQYARRRALTARITAVLGAILAASLSTWLPVQAEYSVGSTAQPPRIAQGAAVPGDTTSRAVLWRNARTVPIPVAVTRPGNDQVRVPLVEIEIATPGGERLRSVLPSPNRPFEKLDLTAVLPSLEGGPPQWLILGFSAPAWERVKGRRVTIRGSAAFEYYHPGAPAVISPGGSGTVAGAGRCTALLVEDRFSEDLLKVLCESPREIPAASVVLRDMASGREWRERLNSSVTYSPGPRETWLSPLNRAQTFFRLAGGPATAPGSRWLVPRETLESARIAITPEIATGHALARFEFDGVVLAAR